MPKLTVPAFLRRAVARLTSATRSADPGLAGELFMLRPGAQLASSIRAEDVLPMAPGQRRAPRPYIDLGGGIACVPFFGVLSKFPSLWRMLGLASAPTLPELTQAVRAAGNAADVRGLLILADSPGGSVAGTLECAQAVAAVARAKPVHCYAWDDACSSMLWIASQASRLTTNAVGHIGSIGIVQLVVDDSEAAKAAGLKFTAVATGAYKGVGYPGIAITDAQIAELQRRVDAINEVFLESVSRGRRMPLDQVRQLADGRVYIGKGAVDVGLVDGVETLDEALFALATAAGVGAGGGLEELSPREPEEEDRPPMLSAAAATADVDRIVAAEVRRRFNAANAEEIAARDLLPMVNAGLSMAAARSAFPDLVDALRSDSGFYDHALSLLDPRNNPLTPDRSGVAASKASAHRRRGGWSR